MSKGDHTRGILCKKEITQEGFYVKRSHEKVPMVVCCACVLTGNHQRSPVPASAGVRVHSPV